MQDLCLQARRAMTAKGKMPPSAHEFALQDMRFSLSERFHLARHAPGHAASSHVFYPGCQLCASGPGQVERVYSYMMEHLPGGVGLMLGCCGCTGALGRTHGRARRNRREFPERLGRPGPAQGDRRLFDLLPHVCGAPVAGARDVPVAVLRRNRASASDSRCSDGIGHPRPMHLAAVPRDPEVRPPPAAAHGRAGGGN